LLFCKCFSKIISVLDENNRFNPTYDENDVKIVDADNVLVSVGQIIDWGDLVEGSKIELNPNKTIKADLLTYQTSEPDIFTGGDALTGPKFAIDAIAAGKQGAISIHRYVQPVPSSFMPSPRFISRTKSTPGITPFASSPSIPNFLPA